MASQNNTPKDRPKVRIPLLIPACVLLTLCALFTVYCAVWRGDLVVTGLMVDGVRY